MAFDFDQLLKDISAQDIRLDAISSDKRWGHDAFLTNYEKIIKKLQQDEKYPLEFENPIGAQLEITFRCNQRCVHCYNRSGVNCIDELDLEEWKRVALELSDMDIFECVISGGEPLLLGEKLFEIMDVLNENSPYFILITNGMLVDEQKIKKLQKYKFRWVQVSIDGADPVIHDKIRGLEGAWEKATMAAFLFKEARFPLVIAHTIVKQNIYSLNEMIDLAYFLGAKRIITGEFIYSGNAIINKRLLELSDSDKKHFYKCVEQKVRDYLGVMEIVLSADPILSLKNRTIEPNQVLLIRPNGDVKFDCIAPFVIGNIREKSLRDIWDAIGKYACQDTNFTGYVKKIKTTNNINLIKPRPYVDVAISIG